MRPWTILVGFAALSGVAAVPPEARAETKQAPASFDGHYIGPGDVAPASGNCAPVAAIELIIKGNNATIRAARIYQNSVASYTTITEYKGSLSGMGKVSVNASSIMVGSTNNFPGSGTIHADSFHGNIMNEDIGNADKTLVCSYNVELHRK